jgi:uncharacterized phage-associated protein
MRAWYNVNPHKALETIVWFANQRDPIDFYHILKVLFYADKYHLNKHGRPILGDTYEAFPHGPVARTVYSLLKRDDALEAQFLSDHARLADDDAFEVKRRYWVSPLRATDLRCFSRSDLEALEWSFRQYVDMSFDELEELTHKEPAWRNARESGGNMKYEDMLEGGENERERNVERVN